ncbi:MAG: hypothetical protein ACP5IK_03860 [Candidatus Micrarchaeia archaeon]
MTIHFGKVGSIKAELLDGEGFWMDKFQGPGKVIMHSVPRFRLAEAFGGGKGSAASNSNTSELKGAAGILGAGLAFGAAENAKGPRFRL